jgi:uncharacterized protein (TIGR00255 family)
MIKSMTGFGNSEANIPGLGKVGFEIRSVNHRYLDVVCHLPEGFSYLEERIKKEIEKKIKRGRVVCLLNVIKKPRGKLLINKQLLKEYYLSLDKLRGQLRIKEPVKLDTLIHLPGVFDVAESRSHKNRIWLKVKALIRVVLLDLLHTRVKEGQALYLELKQRNEELRSALELIKERFKKVIREKINQIPTSEEKNSFIKSTDITEEIVRIKFHGNNFTKKLKKSTPVGKELDFIAQELSREANTMGAKSIDAIISSSVVTMKSQIEKIREQLQNVE